MRRGEIWQYRPVRERPGQSLLRLIVSADFVNEGDGATVLGVHVVDRDPQSLLAPRIGAHGFAAPEEMEQISNALRAAQDL